MTQSVELLRELQEYYGKDLTATQARVYLRHFDRANPLELQQAIDNWIAEHKWFPRVNELQEYIDNVVEVNAERAIRDHRWNMWKASEARNRVMNGQMDRDALKKWPALFDVGNDLHSPEPLGEWWKKIEGKEYDGNYPIG